MAAELAERDDTFEAFKLRYVEALKQIERLHRQLLDVIKAELDRSNRADINSVQALLLFNIGESELTAGELRTRGHYIGSNVSYNLKKLVEGGYIHHTRSEQDRRSVRVRLTEKGFEIQRLVDELFRAHVSRIPESSGMSLKDFEDLSNAFLRLERFWDDQLRFTY